MGKALYRKYRSKSLSEIVGQEHITETLERAIKKGTHSHAYLLTGPRGVGKTSIARILAYELNELPYDEEGTHLDIIEIDAASNRRIDEIRELNDRIHIAPTSARYKVYIIDEVHMLTKEAFNALLKTLEEPPAHAVFILATTEAHKVPETIQSRTQRYTFKPVNLDKVSQHLAHIAKQENITIDKEALELIAEHGEGSFRDSISLLDQIRHTSDSITITDVQRAIGQAPTDLLQNLISALAAGQLTAIAQATDGLRSHGIQPAQIAKQLAQILRIDIANNKTQLPLHKTLTLLNKLLEVAQSSDPGLALELALYGSALEEQSVSVTSDLKATAHKTIDKAPNIPDKAPQREAKKPEQKPQSPAPTAEPEAPAPEMKATPESTAAINKTSSLEPQQALDETTWPDVLAAVKSRHNTLYSITRMAVPSFESDKVILKFAFPFHQKRLADNKNRQVLAEIITEKTGQRLAIEVILDSDARNKTTEDSVASPVESPDISNISNIFGGVEVVN